MKKLIAVAVLSAALLLESQAFAGLSSILPVQVGSNYAEGSLRSARSSANNVEFIGCTLSPAQSSNYVFCQATNAAGQSYYCINSSAPDVWAATLASMNSADLLYFYGDASHHCTGIYVEPYSFYM
jgi:hypothetical protein